MTKKQSYLEEAWAYWQEQTSRLLAARYGRRLIFRGGTLLALGGASALQALLAACAPGREAEDIGQRIETGWRYSPYPLVERYNWRNLPWGEPLYIGGHALEPSSPPSRWDPNFTDLNLTGGRVWQRLVFNGGHGDFEDLDRVVLKPELASDYSHAPDFSYWDFTIPDNVYFHNIPPANGRRVTAEDVRFAFEVYRTNSLWQAGLDQVERIEVVGGDRVRFHMKRPYLDLPWILAAPSYWVFAPEHYQGDQDYWKTQPIGTGFWQVTSSRFRDKWERARHPRYRLAGRPDDVRWAGVQLPFIDSSTGYFFADAAARRSAFRTGQIDNFGGVFTQIDLEDILATNPEAMVMVSTGACARHTRIVMQLKDPLFQDVRVRRALSMAMDRRALSEVGWGAFSIPLSPICWLDLGRRTPHTLEELGPYWQYNPTEAKRLLEEAGYKDGLELEYETTTPTDWQLLLQQQWAAVGIRIRWKEVESTVLAADRNAKRFTHLITAGATVGTFGLWEAQNHFLPDSPTNFASVNDPVLTDLIRRAQATLDKDEQTRLLNQVQERELDQVHYLWVEGGHRGDIWHPWLHHAGENVRGQMCCYDSHAWVWAWLKDTAPGGRGGKRAA